MAEDWAIDVKKYAPDADDGVIAAIVRHCGIALQSRDASLVAFTDPAELDVVRESWLKKKLGLTDPDSALDAAIAKVGARMKADHTKNRVTVYYLLAEAFDKLGMFGLVAPAAASVAAAAGPVAAAAMTPPPAPASLRAPVAPPVVESSGGGFGRMALLALLGLAAIGLIWWWMHRPTATTEVVTETVTTGETVVPAPPPAAAPVIPTGAGVTAEEVDGKPKVSVYFDTAKTDVSPDFATVAAPVKAYVDSHPGTVLGISGFNDPRGDAAMNAELSKNRAKSVRAALVALGVAESATDLVKPADTTDTTDALAEGRRVDIYVK